MLELRGGHLDLVDLAGQPWCCTCRRWAAGRRRACTRWAGRQPGGCCRRAGGCTPGAPGHGGDDVVLGLALGLAGHLEAEEVLAAGLLELGLEGLDLDVVGLGHVLDLIGLPL